jgi:hypothetical protein
MNKMGAPQERQDVAWCIKVGSRGLVGSSLGIEDPDVAPVVGLGGELLFAEHLGFRHAARGTAENDRGAPALGPA